MTAKLQPDSPGSLAFGRIAEPGWSARIKNLGNGETQQRDLVVDRQQETLFLDFDAAGDYEVEFSYLPTGFVIGSVISLISLAILNLWWLAVCWLEFRAVLKGVGER